VRKVERSEIKDLVAYEKAREVLDLAALDLAHGS